MKHQHFWLNTFILLGSFLVRIWNLSEISLWSDELFTIFFANAPFDRFFSLLLIDGVHLPVYFTLMRFVPDKQELMVRFPSVLAGVVGVALLMFIVRRLYKNEQAALWAGALLAFNPYHVWLSRVARPYALFFVVALLTAHYFLILLRGERSWINWGTFLVISTTVYLTHFFAVAMPLAQYILLAFVLRQQYIFLRKWIVTQVIAGIPLLIWIYALSQQEAVSFGTAWIPKVSILDIPRTFSALTSGYDNSSAWYMFPSAIVAVMGVGVGSFNAIREHRLNLVNFYWFWLIYPVIIIVFLISSLLRSVYVDRYFIVLLPAILMLMIIGWQRQPRWTAIALGIVVGSGLLHIAITLYHEDDELQDWRSAMTFVQENYQEGDGFIMQKAITLLPFQRYYSDEQPHESMSFDYEELEKVPDTLDRIWVIYRNPHVNIHSQIVAQESDPYQDYPPISNWLQERRNRILIRKDFNGVSVFLVDNTQ